MPNLSSFMDPSNFKEILGSVALTKIIPGILIFLVCLLVIRLLMKLIDRLMEKSPTEKKLHTLSKSGIKIFLYFIAVIISADTMGIPITSLVAVLSVAGLAASLALQDSLTNLVSGVMLMISKPFVVGDYIEAGDIEGTASDIGLIYTVIKTFDNKVIYVPNRQIAAAKIINYTAEDSRRLDLTFSASYQNEIEPVKKVIAETVNSHPKIKKDPAPLIRVLAYADSSIQYAVKVWVDTPDYWDVHFDLLENVKHAFDQNHIEIPFQQMNVHIVEK